MRRKTRRNKRGQYRTSWRNRLLPLVFLIASILLGLFIQSYFSEQELKSPCEPECKFFMVRAVETIEPETTEVVETVVLSEKEQIIQYITQVFGKDAPDAFNILYCENRGLRPDAVNYNRNGSIDEGIFQINSIHKQTDMTNWKKNIDFAYKLFKRGGWSQWSCSHRIDVTPFYLK